MANQRMAGNIGSWRDSVFGGSKAKPAAQPEPKAAPQPAAKAAAPSYSGSLAQFAGSEGFGGGAFERARAAGYSDPQIKAGVEQLRGQGMAIGKQVDIALNPQQYGNEMAQRGAQQGGFVDMGSDTSYGMRAIILPEDLKNVGGGKGVVWAAGPMTDQQIINMYRNQPRETYVLPASVSAPGQPYRAPSGVSFIDPTATPSQQAIQASAGRVLQQAPAPAAALPSKPATAAAPQFGAAAATTAATPFAAPAKAKQEAPSAKAAAVPSAFQKKTAQPAAQERAGQLLNTWIQSVIGKKQTQKDTDWDWLYARNPSMKAYFS